MSKQPLVSVIINCYNGEKYLRETIDSVIAQTYKNWEIIFWDNQSTDSSAEIVKSYQDDRIRYFKAPVHTPLGKARNLAMEKANGEYWGFLDADDVWNCEFINRAVQILTNNDNLIGYYSNYYVTYTNTFEENCRFKDGIQNIRRIISDYRIGMSACIFFSDVVKKNSIVFNNAYQLIEDLDFFTKVLLYGDFYYDSTPLMKYKKRSSSATNKRVRLWYEEYSKYIAWSKNLMAKGILNKEDLINIEHLCKIAELETNVEDSNKLMVLKMLLSDWPLFKKKWRTLIFLLIGKEKTRKLQELRKNNYFT